MLVIFGQQIPSLLEYFDGIRFNGDGITSSLTEYSICHHQLMILFHGVDNGLIEALLGEN